jgi:hypothetical protein
LPARTAWSDVGTPFRGAYRLPTATSLRFAAQASLPTYTFAGSVSKRDAGPARSRQRVFWLHYVTAYTISMPRNLSWAPQLPCTFGASALVEHHGFFSTSCACRLPLPQPSTHVSSWKALSRAWSPGSSHCASVRWSCCCQTLGGLVAFDLVVAAG